MAPTATSSRPGLTPGAPAKSGTPQNAQLAQGGNPRLAVGDHPRVTQVTARAGEILGRIVPFNTAFAEDDRTQQDAIARARDEVIVPAFEAGVSLTAYLESLDPSENYDRSDPLGQMDAFDRQLWLSGIRTMGDAQNRIFPDVVERFYLSDQPASPILFPEFINRQIRVAMIAPPILDEIVAVTTPIDSDSYRAIYLQDTASVRQLVRVEEMAELPTVKVVTSEKSVPLHKYGRRIIGSYEAFRRMRIDLFSLHLSRIALQAQLDKSSEALAAIINGDGNSNPSANWNLSALDPNTTPSHLTYYAWLRWGLKLFPYQLTTVVAGEAEMLAILTLQFPNINPLLLLSLLQQGGPGPVNSRLELAHELWSPNLRLVYFPYAPTNVPVGIDKRTGIEMITEIGATLTETDRIISKQYNEITISEVVGFAQLIPQALQTLTLNA